MRWLRSLTRITYLSKLIGILSLAAFLKLELFRVYSSYIKLRAFHFITNCIFSQSFISYFCFSPYSYHPICCFFS
ncbi:hypothetical protein D5071_19115 [Pectobacterium carotovorum]|uniref:Uncharacterized protein n=1 Tax=Pectobacterium carotovorum TaxID=554 RepID=A0A419ARN6_PECCA|nr:hypothetical protein D5071_19115 [Pectobacterium carotovorum]